MVRYACRLRLRLWRQGIPTADLPDRAVNENQDSRNLPSATLTALRRLPAKQRVVLVLRYWGDESKEQIASELGIPLGTVKSRTARAIQALRKDTGLRRDSLKENLS